MAVCRDLPATAHERVAKALRERIRSGAWRPGQMLPGRRQLAQEHGVALNTADRAVTTLISEGLLRADDRRGTFVAKPATIDAALAAVLPTGGEGAIAATVGIVATVYDCHTSGEREVQWPMQILRGCEHRLGGEPGLTMRFLNLWRTGQPPLDAQEAVAQLLDDGVDAVIVIGLYPAPDFIARFGTLPVPMVFTEYVLAQHPFPQVYADDVAAGGAAARHLLERGYRHLVYFQPFVVDWVAERLAGVKSVVPNLADADLLRVLPATVESLHGQEDQQQQLAQRRADQVLDDHWQAGTGVIAPNDMTAIAFMTAARRRGLEAGQDYGLVGFDDRCRDDGLTSLRPPLTELGEEAATLAIRLLRGQPAPSRIALPHRLIARHSSAPYRPTPQEPSPLVV